MLPNVSSVKQTAEEPPSGESGNCSAERVVPSPENVVRPFARGGRPQERLKPCPICGGWRYAWLIGADYFSCAHCDPPPDPTAVATYLIVLQRLTN
jgi:hypothetical protein